MLRFADYDIVFQEVPDETTLALNLSGCPHHCAGCHSPHLWEEAGEELSPAALDRLIATYPYVTCVGLMGGDADLEGVVQMASYIHRIVLKTAWYTGLDSLPAEWDMQHFDYIKVGPYIAALGGLKERTTNQRFYAVVAGQLVDRTDRFWR